MRQFRFTCEAYETQWMNCSDWTIEEIDILAADIAAVYGDTWQMEFR